MIPDKDRREPDGLPLSNAGSAAIASLPSVGGGAKRAWKLRSAFFALVVLYFGVAVYQSCLKPLPANLSLAGEWHPVASEDVEFLCDVTGMKDGQRVCQQAIFDRALQLIGQAEDFVLVDLFLFNEYLGAATNIQRRLCQEVCAALLEKKRTRPQIQMVVVTDPVNGVYGGPLPTPLRKLQAAGIPIVLTDLAKLRDSNSIYSPFWRIFVQWFGTSSRGFMPHPFPNEPGRVGIRSWLALLNFKANHRKLIVADAPSLEGGREMVGMVMSANPHDASSAHGNVALLVRSGIWQELLQGEQAILSFSGQTSLDLFTSLPSYAKTRTPSDTQPMKPAKARVLTEGKIRKGMLEVISGLQAGDTLEMGMFYLSERNVLNALSEAARRGAIIRLLLDPNRDAFGHEKNGVPNRPVAAELVQKSGGKISVRWFNTHGEQFHTKMLLATQGNQATLFVGSANLTRRNIGDLNLETNLMVTGSRDLPAFQAAQQYFERLWSNQDLECTVPYETFQEHPNSWKHWQYRVQERTGLSTF